MIEHRLYEIELYENGQVLERQILLMTPYDATIYRLKGYNVYDYTASLNMEPEYLEEACERNLTF